MSPELCAGEKYTLYSDVWSMGCIMYQLCAKKPPFNENSYIKLVGAIRDAKPDPLPDVYSAELKSVILSCLKLNPDRRPDTAALLNQPVIRLMRKEKEVAQLGKSLRSKEETVAQKMKEVEHGYARLEKERSAFRQETENALRREWEVKARLEIDRQVQMELENLRQRFDTEIQQRVTAELQKHNTVPAPEATATTETAGASVENTSGSSGYDTDLPSSTDLSSFSLESSVSEEKKPIKKGNTTPLARSKTTVDSPLDVHMAEPSPVSLDSLSLSPRRTAAAKSRKNIFAEAEKKDAKYDAKYDAAPLYSDDEDDIPDLPSPTRPKIKTDPLKAPQRPLLRQNTTAMMQTLSSQPTLFPSGKAPAQPSQSGAPSGQSDTRQTNASGPPKSPHRRLSKIPSCTNIGESGSPPRKGATKSSPSKASGGGEEMFKAVLQRNMGGRTLIELSQARAGRSSEEGKRSGESRIPTAGGPSQQQTTAYMKAVDRDPPATWDPERDEMPSPFLARGKVIRNLR